MNLFQFFSNLVHGFLFYFLAVFFFAGLFFLIFIAKITPKNEKNHAYYKTFFALVGIIIVSILAIIVLAKIKWL